jgi:hypothetical protein
MTSNTLTRTILVFAAVTCGPHSRVYCFKCGDFVYHPVFECERQRIDIATCLPWMAWGVHPVQRSFDALQFMRLQDQDLYWRGMMATYPPMVPEHHAQACRSSWYRYNILRGNVERLPLDMSNAARVFASRQAIKSKYMDLEYVFLSVIWFCLIDLTPGSYSLSQMLRTDTQSPHLWGYTI